MSDTALKRRTGKQTDMLHGPLLKKIILFSLPLALCGILQQLFNSADVAVIGWFEDGTAQAAVNSNGPLINLLINLFTGLSVGVTVVIAEYVGKSRTDDVHSVTLTATVVALVSGAVLLIVGVSAAAPILSLMKTPSGVLPLASEYLRIYFAGMPFVMLYNIGAAILRSVGDTRRPLYSLIAAGVLNVGLNMLFVAVLDMSVAGVAAATVISDALSAVLVYIFIMKDNMLRIRFKKSAVRALYLKKIFKIGLPAGLQGVVFSVSNVFIQTSINGFGDKAMAGNGDALYFETYVYYFVSAFVQAAVTFIGQNYAARNFERCKKIFWQSMLSALAVSTLLCVVFTLGGKYFIRIYSSDKEVIEYALMRFKYVLIFEMIACSYEIAGGALRAIGHSLLPAVITVVGSCVLRIIWLYTGFAANPQFWMLLIIYPITWAVTGTAMLIAYFVITKKAYKRDNSAQPHPTQTEEHDGGEDLITAQASVTDDTDDLRPTDSETDDTAILNE